MAIPTIDLAFIKQYEAEVHEAYQRQGSKLRGMVRKKSGVVGYSTTFQLAGKGSAVSKARNASIPPMNVSHSNVECTLVDKYAGDWIDKLDELKTNIDERRIVANAGAYALGRVIDDQIVTALDSVAASQNVTGAGNLADSAAFTKEKALRALEILGAQDVPDDGMRFAIVGVQEWSSLLGITEFVNSQYVGPNDLPFAAPVTQMKRWLGVNWMQFPALPVTTLVRNNFMFHMSAVGQASGQEITADITWHGDRAAHFVNHFMSMGAVLIDPLGVVRIKATET